MLNVALSPGSPSPHTIILRMTFDPEGKAEGEPGIFWHVSNRKGDQVLRKGDQNA